MVEYKFKGIITEKYCPDCKQTLSTDNFYVKKGTWLAKRTGLKHNYTYFRWNCKSCHRKEVREGQVHRIYILNSIKREKEIAFLRLSSNVWAN